MPDFKRLLEFESEEHVLLLGARGTGKSTFLKTQFSRRSEECLWIDLLLPSQEDRYSRDPELLLREVTSLPDHKTTVVIDEIQKVPALLDVVHALIESTQKRFILTGSSARKLRTGSANLLAGRAIAYSMFPLSVFEIGEKFDLTQALMYGTLPKVWNLKTTAARRKTLATYALTYLQEEIRSEQIIKDIDPFRKFLEVAAQLNGKILNFAKIAADVRIDEKTVRRYFQILEDTLLGFFLEPYDRSTRKKIGQAPKFYFFDTGVTRALARTLTIDLLPGNYAWGNAFEHFVILELHRMVHYSGNQFSLHFLRTYSDQEIDVVVKRPGKSTLLVEIKSTSIVEEDHLKTLMDLAQIIEEPCERLCLSCDPKTQIISGVKCLPWQQGIAEYFGGPDVKV